MGPQKSRLLLHGVVLFLIGLLTGLALAGLGSMIANPRGVLAGHLEALMNGTFLLVVAFFVDDLRLSDKLRRVLIGLLLFGTYGNWFGTTLAGVLGTSEATPLAGAGHQGSQLAEKFVLGWLGAVALSMVAAVVILIIGLRRRTLAPSS